MSVAFGYNGYVGVAKETTWGTYVPATDFGRANSEGVSKAREFLVPDLIGSGRFQQVRLDGNETVSGSIDFPVNVEDLVGFLLKDLLGTETAMSLESGSAGSHLFVPKSTLGLAGLSMEFNRDAGVHANNVWKASGGHTNAITLAYEAGQPLKCTADMSFQNMISGGTAQSPTYGAMGRYLMCHTGTAEFPDATAASIFSANVKIEAALMADRFPLASKLILEQMPGIYQVTGQVVLQFDSLDRVTDYLNSTARSLDLQLTGETIAGSTAAKLQILLGNIYLDGQTPVLSDTGEIRLTIPFRSISGTAATLASITVWNSQATAY